MILPRTARVLGAWEDLEPEGANTVHGEQRKVGDSLRESPQVAESLEYSNHGEPFQSFPHKSCEVQPAREVMGLVVATLVGEDGTAEEIVLNKDEKMGSSSEDRGEAAIALAMEADRLPLRRLMRA